MHTSDAAKACVQCFDRLVVNYVIDCQLFWQSINQLEICFMIQAS